MPAKQLEIAAFLRACSSCFAHVGGSGEPCGARARSRHAGQRNKRSAAAAQTWRQGGPPPSPWIRAARRLPQGARSGQHSEHQSHMPAMQSAASVQPGLRGDGRPHRDAGTRHHHPDLLGADRLFVRHDDIQNRRQRIPAERGAGQRAEHQRVLGLDSVLPAGQRDRIAARPHPVRHSGRRRGGRRLRVSGARWIQRLHRRRRLHRVHHGRCASVRAAVSPAGQGLARRRLAPLSGFLSDRSRDVHAAVRNRWSQVQRSELLRLPLLDQCRALDHLRQPAHSLDDRLRRSGQWRPGSERRSVRRRAGQPRQPRGQRSDHRLGRHLDGFRLLRERRRVRLRLRHAARNARRLLQPGHRHRPLLHAGRVQQRGFRAGNRRFNRFHAGQGLRAAGRAAHGFVHWAGDGGRRHQREL